MSKSFEEFYESWMEEQLYMAGRLWEQEQLILEQELKHKKVYEYNQHLPWEIQETDERNDSIGPNIPSATC
jgi:hypothetical protein